MRIDGPGGPGQIKRPRGGAKSDRSTNVFSFSQSERSETAAGTAASGPIGGIDALLALQSVEEPGARGRRLKHGHDMLDLLDDIKITLLAGDVPAAKLQSLVDTVGRRPDRYSDERIESVLDEIELRARVELAKMGREAA
ncbi:flagellar assembly protein FliX [Microbaculum sp. FT89]|uniref:flagellar assembly protein FliX n=1 Tax=Microbaculum sp. FT89 TaxID=3447298 RepID=UPI003F533330